VCGIVGYVGQRGCVPVLMDGLARVAYRGYDSAGLAVLGPSGALRIHRRAGRLAMLEEILPRRLAGKVGIGHTRWATHGDATDRNAHPHTDGSGRIAIVHNGIVENAAALRRQLEAEGFEFRSDTDSECLAHLIGRERFDASGAARTDLADAVRRALVLVEGAYGLAVLDATSPGRIVVARTGSPVIIGVGEGETLVASDVAVLVPHTRRVVPLDDGELAVLDRHGFATTQLDATPIQKRPFSVTWSIEDFDRGGHADFMHKEIHEQPDAVRRALAGRLDQRYATARLGGLPTQAEATLRWRRVKLLGAGSAYYAGLAGAHLIEQLARIPADAEPAAEFRYRNAVLDPDTLYVAISQSGETADTLAAVEEIRWRGGRVIGLVNVAGSSIARACDGVFLHAGPEVSVCSTKVFTSMLVCLALVALHLGRVRDLSHPDGRRLMTGLEALPDAIQDGLAAEETIAAIARRYAAAPSMFFIARASGFPIAREGAQKLKEISYIHAEAYPASELKHGPLALVDERFPSVVLLPDDVLRDKNISTIEQIRARHGPVIGVVQDRTGANGMADAEAGLFDATIRVPASAPELAPILFAVPLQLFAYHTAVALRRDIDQPRNLAKSVTVE
jgi:glutamine---fructose-6-phosphate transaminase (isomerizing)